jgi:hypothetical protein
MSILTPITLLKAPSKLKKGHVNSDTNNPVKAPSKLKRGHVNIASILIKSTPAKSSFKAERTISIPPPTVNSSKP